jgi:acetyl esterase
MAATTTGDRVVFDQRKATQMKRFIPFAILAAAMSVVAHTAAAADSIPNAATDPRIDPAVRSFLAVLDKDSSPFRELPRPKPREILSAIQNKSPVDMSGVKTTEQTITADGRPLKLYIMRPECFGR